jgi:hypothetical protein
MSTKWQRFNVDLSDFNLTKDEKADVGDLIVERIVNRTDKGIDVDGEKFAKYSKGYIDSLNFKIAGKSKGKVNLQLSGDMLAALKVLKDKGDSLTIGFEKGSDENAKADGNIRGTYGKDKPNPFLSRDFLGISNDELIKIVKTIKRGTAKGNAI